MFDALTRSQMLILRHAQAGAPQPAAGRFPVSYLEDIEVLMLMKLLIMKLGVTGITEFGAAYLRLTDAGPHACDMPAGATPTPAKPEKP
jgi:hypothetical protein